MENKFKEFINKYNGTFVEKVDASSPNQCFDLAIAWCEALGLPLSVFSGLMYAYQIWEPSTVMAMENFERIPNTPDAVPQAGDIVVWDKKFNGTAGHVGIATGNFSDTTKFQCFEQNDPTGSNSHLKDYNYNHVVGWLRYKESPSDNALAECLRLHKQLVDETVLLKKQLTEKDIVISNNQLELLKVREELARVSAEAIDYKGKYEKTEELRAKWLEAYNQANTNYETCKVDRTTFQKQLTECLNKGELTWGELIIKVWEKIRGVKI